jgi:hypothetical protein
LKVIYDLKNCVCKNLIVSSVVGLLLGDQGFGGVDDFGLIDGVSIVVLDGDLVVGLLDVDQGGGRKSLGRNQQNENGGKALKQFFDAIIICFFD